MLSSCTAWRHMMEWRYSSNNFNLNTRWRWAVSSMPNHYNHVESTPQYPLKRRHGGPQSWIGRFAKEQNLLPCWKVTHNCLDVQSAAWQLHYLNCPECNWALPPQLVILFHIWCWQPLLLMTYSAAQSHFQTSGNRGLTVFMLGPLPVTDGQNSQSLRFITTLTLNWL